MIMSDTPDTPAPDAKLPPQDSTVQDTEPREVPSDEVLLQQVAELINEQTDIDIDSIKMDSEFESLGIDSLDAIEIIFEAEEKYDLSIPDRAARNMRNVGDVVKGVATLLRGEEIYVPEPPAPEVKSNLDTGSAQADSVREAVEGATGAKVSPSDADDDSDDGNAQATGG